MKKIFYFLFFFTFLFSGCDPTMIVSPIVTGVIMWKDGEASKYYEENLNNTYRSVKLSLHDLDIKYEEKKSSPNSFYIVTKDAKKCKITIKFIRPNITLVSIRVDFMGDKPYAELIYKKIDKNTNVIVFN